ncbi:MAG: hypothetical protein AAF735_01250 [Myxococcota bacterium]
MRSGIGSDDPGRVSLWTENALIASVALAAVIGTLIVLHRLEQLVSRYLSKRLGWNSVLFTGWLGVPIHELSHLLAARLFGHRVVAYRLFEPDPVTGTLGYVRHAYSRRNLWQLSGSFFVGVAPVVAGGLCLALLVWLALPGISLDTVQAVLVGSLRLPIKGQELLQALSHHATPWLGLYIYLALCVASHLSPSAADLKNGAIGAVLCVALIAFAVILCTLAEISLAPVRALYPVLAALIAGVALLQLSYAASVALLHRVGLI